MKESHRNWAIAAVVLTLLGIAVVVAASVEVGRRASTRLENKREVYDRAMRDLQVDAR